MHPLLTHWLGHLCPSSTTCELTSHPAAHLHASALRPHSHGVVARVCVCRGGGRVPRPASTFKRKALRPGSTGIRREASLRSWAATNIQSLLLWADGLAVGRARLAILV